MGIARDTLTWTFDKESVRKLNYVGLSALTPTPRRWGARGDWPVAPPLKFGLLLKGG